MGFTTRTMRGSERKNEMDEIVIYVGTNVGHGTRCYCISDVEDICRRGGLGRGGVYSGERRQYIHDNW